jgi:hypothetical protein
VRARVLGGEGSGFLIITGSIVIKSIKRYLIRRVYKGYRSGILRLAASACEKVYT